MNEILFGKSSKISPLQNNLNNLKEEFSDVEKIKIFVGTWNTASTESSKIKKNKFRFMAHSKRFKNSPRYLLCRIRRSS